MCRTSPETLEAVEAKALADDKVLRAGGRRKTNAAKPAFRVRGPLLFEAEGFGISFMTGIKKNRRVVFADELEDGGRNVVEIDAVDDPAPDPAPAPIVP